MIFELLIMIIAAESVKGQDTARQVFGQCTNPDGVKGDCIYLNECEELSRLLTKRPLHDLEKEFLSKSQCGYHDTMPLVCCASDLLPNPPACGIFSTRKIVGGNATRDYPWMALLQYTKPGGETGFQCGGALIHNRYIMTAAHCIKGAAIPPDWTLTAVRLGEYNISSEIDCDGNECSDPVVDVAIEEVITHENYNPSSKNQLHDIALLRLSKFVNYTGWIKPICLPKAQVLRNTDLQGFNAHVAGWGRTENNTPSEVKLKAAVGCVALEQCNRVYGQFNVVLQDTQLCAGGVKGVDSCSGDSGGPLIAINRTEKPIPYYFAAGVVSFGPKPCALQGWPGVYTKVGRYIGWIQNHMRA